MLKPYEELRKVDVSKHCKKRDGFSYLSWAKCVDLLHQNGAETVYFVPVTNSVGSSLLMSEQEFEDKNGVKNRCYEVAVEIHIDDKVYYMQSPLMNGSNPVKDNSMSQQRVWNAQTRAFVKGVAIYTGLGFDLWLDEEDRETAPEDDLYKHNILAIKERIELLITSKMSKGGMSLDQISDKLSMTEDEIKAIIAQCFTIYRLEQKIQKL